MLPETARTQPLILKVLRGTEVTRSPCPLLKEGTSLSASAEPPPCLLPMNHRASEERAQRCQLVRTSLSEGVQAHPLHFGGSCPHHGASDPACSACSKSLVQVSRV